MERLDEDPYEEHIYEELDPNTFKLTPKEQLLKAQETEYEESWRDLEASMSSASEPMLGKTSESKGAGAKKRSYKDGTQKSRTQRSSTQSSPHSSSFSSLQSSPQSSSQSSSQSSPQGNAEASGSQSSSKWNLYKLFTNRLSKK